MGNCITNIEIPPSLTHPCDGKNYDDNCVLHPEALVELGISAGSSVNTIINSMYMAIASMQARITELENI